MELEELTRSVRATMDQVREALARLESEAQARDRPEVHALSQAYARLVALLRDYLAGAQRGRPLPRQLARRLADQLEPLVDHESEIARLGLAPSVSEVTELIRLAESAT